MQTLKILKQIAFLSALSILIMGASSAPSDDDLQFIGFTILLHNVDAQCKYLEDDEHEQVEQMYQESLKHLNDAALRQRVLNQFGRDKFNCKRGEGKQWVEMYRNLHSPSNEDHTVNDDDLRKALDDNIGSLPKDQLKSIAGCWDGQLVEWPAHFCFSNDGNSFDATLTSRDQKVVCAFNGGVARKREGKAWFYAFGSAPECSDNRPIAHLEGFCVDYEKVSMRCYMTVFTGGNQMLMVKDNTPLNGDFTVTRSK